MKSNLLVFLIVAFEILTTSFLFNRKVLKSAMTAYTVDQIKIHNCDYPDISPLTLQDLNSQLDKWILTSGESSIYNKIAKSGVENRDNDTFHRSSTIIHVVNDIPDIVGSEKALHYLKKRWFGSSNKAHNACKRGHVKVNNSLILIIK